MRLVSLRRLRIVLTMLGGMFGSLTGLLLIALLEENAFIPSIRTVLILTLFPSTAVFIPWVLVSSFIDHERMRPRQIAEGRCPSGT